LFDQQQARKVGIPPTTLDRLVAAEKLIRVGENLFLHPDLSIDPQVVELAVACRLLGPKATIGGLSALHYYRLTDTGSVSQIWVLVPPERNTRRTLYRVIRTTTTLNKEITKEYPGYRVVSLERAIVEAFRYATKLGLETAFYAAKVAFDTKQTTPGKLLKVARMLKLEQSILPHWEALLALEQPS
jgi:hypothetical protein